MKFSLIVLYHQNGIIISDKREKMDYPNNSSGFSSTINTVFLSVINEICGSHRGFEGLNVKVVEAASLF